MTLTIYLIQSFIQGIYETLKNWFFDSFLFITHAVIATLEKLDRIFALKITLKHFFKPLYQDYSIIGFTIGIMTRFFLILIGSFIYLIISLFGLFIYLIWMLFLITAFYNILPLFYQ